jgi:hypothetical protein
MVEEAGLRHPWERAIFFASVLLNLGIMVGAFFLLRTAHDWLREHPLVAKTLKHVELLAIAAVFAPPAIVLVRNARRGFILGNTVRVSKQQIPEMYAILEAQCLRLGLDHMPDLHVSDQAIELPAHAYSVWQQEYIVITQRFAEPTPDTNRDVVSFMLASELGRIRLGHTRWWYELALAYVIRIPYLRNPMTQVEILSQDRYGAFLEPGAVRGLIAQASGRRMLQVVNIPDYLKQTREYGGVWAFLSNLTRSTPHVAYRIQALWKAGLLESPGGLAT